MSEMGAIYDKAGNYNSALDQALEMASASAGGASTRVDKSLDDDSASFMKEYDLPVFYHHGQGKLDGMDLHGEEGVCGRTVHAIEI
jgi:hypothetical protein